MTAGYPRPQGRRRRLPGRRAIASRFRIPVLLLVFALVYGTVGYHSLEGWTWLDAVYMTVTTLTTVGFQEVHHLDPGGRLFTLSVIAIGLGSLFATIGISTDLFASGELEELLRGRRMERAVKGLSNHFIICAYGRVGRAAAAELRQEGAPVVVIETKTELASLLEEEGVPYLMHDPTEEHTLLLAGIERAQGLVCAMDSDASNVYITLTARALNPTLVIVARAGTQESVDRLTRAGADRVVSPYQAGGQRMGFMALRPSVVDFVDMVTVAPDMRLEELRITRGSSLVGMTIEQASAVHPDVAVLALKHQGQDLIASPAPATVLSVGDLVVVLGPKGALQTLVTPRR